MPSMSFVYYFLFRVGRAYSQCKYNYPYRHNRNTRNKAPVDRLGSSGYSELNNQLSAKEHL